MLYTPMPKRCFVSPMQFLGRSDASHGTPSPTDASHPRPCTLSALKPAEPRFPPSSGFLRPLIGLSNENPCPADLWCLLTDKHTVGLRPASRRRPGHPSRLTPNHPDCRRAPADPTRSLPTASGGCGSHGTAPPSALAKPDCRLAMRPSCAGTAARARHIRA